MPLALLQNETPIIRGSLPEGQILFISTIDDKGETQQYLVDVSSLVMDKGKLSLYIAQLPEKTQVALAEIEHARKDEITVNNAFVGKRTYGKQENANRSISVVSRTEEAHATQQGIWPEDINKYENREAWMAAMQQELRQAYYEYTRLVANGTPVGILLPYFIDRYGGIPSVDDARLMEMQIQGKYEDNLYEAKGASDEVQWPRPLHPGEDEKEWLEAVTAEYTLARETYHQQLKDVGPETTKNLIKSFLSKYGLGFTDSRMIQESAISRYEARLFALQKETAPFIEAQRMILQFMPRDYKDLTPWRDGEGRVLNPHELNYIPFIRYLARSHRLVQVAADNRNHGVLETQVYSDDYQPYYGDKDYGYKGYFVLRLDHLEQIRKMPEVFEKLPDTIKDRYNRLHYNELVGTYAQYQFPRVSERHDQAVRDQYYASAESLRPVNDWLRVHATIEGDGEQARNGVNFIDCPIMATGNPAFPLRLATRRELARYNEAIAMAEGWKVLRSLRETLSPLEIGGLAEPK